MKRRSNLPVAYLAVLFFAAALTFPARAANQGEILKGYVTDTWCGVNRDTKPPTVACTRACVRSGRAQYAFYDLSSKKVYVLEPQSRAAAFAGQTVTVRGVLSSDTQLLKTMRGDRRSNMLTISSISQSK